MLGNDDDTLAHVHVRQAHRQRRSQGVLSLFQALEVCSCVYPACVETTVRLNVDSLSLGLMSR
jgi:hypothetical protein